MKKLFIVCVIMVLVIASLGTTSSATAFSDQKDDSYETRASSRISSYAIAIQAYSDGIINFDCRIYGTGIMDVIGEKSIKVQKYVSGTWTTLKTFYDYYDYNTWHSCAYGTIKGIVVSQYRVVIVFYAQDKNGISTRTVNSRSVTAKD